MYIISPCLSLSAATWPGVADMFVHYVDLEREAATKSKKGVGDLEVGKVLRLIIRTADNEQRAGSTLMYLMSWKISHYCQTNACLAR